MLHITNNLLNDSDLKTLQEICENFENHNVDKPIGNESNNSYYRVFIKPDLIENYYKNLDDYLKNIIDKGKYNILNLPKPNSWINKVIPETNKNDTFHYDMSYLTAVTYLNDDFENGEFEYRIDNLMTQRIKPEKNKTLVMDESLYHRVAPVSKGVRFSLITFYQFNEKEKKTLL